LYKYIITHWNSSNFNSVTKRTIGANLLTKRQRGRSAGVRCKVYAATVAARLVKPQLQTERRYVLREPLDGNKYDFRWADGVPIVHVEASSTTAGNKSRIKGTNSRMYGCTEGCTGQGVALQHPILRLEIRLWHACRREEDASWLGVRRPEKRYQTT
jgi:hypothetical protein